MGFVKGKQLNSHWDIVVGNFFFVSAFWSMFLVVELWSIERKFRPNKPKYYWAQYPSHSTHRHHKPSLAMNAAATD